MLVNPKGLDAFDKKMFFMAIHFLQKAKSGNDLPIQVPQEMIISLDPESYFNYM
jgi:hypothetical protein